MPSKKQEPTPTVFRCERYPSLVVFNGENRVAIFEGGRFETTDEDVIAHLERVPEVSKE